MILLYSAPEMGVSTKKKGGEETLVVCESVSTYI